jgi:hypothetical protein
MSVEDTDIADKELVRVGTGRHSPLTYPQKRDPASSILERTIRDCRGPTWVGCLHTRNVLTIHDVVDVVIVNFNVAEHRRCRPVEVGLGDLAGLEPVELVGVAGVGSRGLRRGCYELPADRGRDGGVLDLEQASDT